MKCPSCKNKHFVPSEDARKPLVTYKLDPYETFDLRYKMCLQCGYRWVNRDAFEREINILKAPTLFDAG